MLIVFVGWAFFDASEWSKAFEVIGCMFGVSASAFAGSEALYYLRSYALTFVIGILGSTPLLKLYAEKLSEKQTLMTILEPMVILLILITSTAKMVDGSFNPFIYFRF
jgi:alginate O-acetyltransferase complex protein AlgI